MDKIMIIFCILTIYVNSVVSKDGQDDLPPFQPRIEDLQLPLFPTEARQISGSELSNGKISQQKPAQALAPIVNGGNENAIKNKTNVISVVDFPSSFDDDFDSDVEDSSEDNTKATADLADVTSQPQHMTNGKNLSPDRTTVSPKEEDEVANRESGEQQVAWKNKQDLAQLPEDDTQQQEQFPPVHQSSEEHKQLLQLKQILSQNQQKQRVKDDSVDEKDEAITDFDYLDDDDIDDDENKESYYYDMESSFANRNNEAEIYETHPQPEQQQPPQQQTQNQDGKKLSIDYDSDDEDENANVEKVRDFDFDDKKETSDEYRDATIAGAIYKPIYDEKENDSSSSSADDSEEGSYETTMKDDFYGDDDEDSEENENNSSSSDENDSDEEDEKNGSDTDKTYKHEELPDDDKIDSDETDSASSDSDEDRARTIFDEIEKSRNWKDDIKIFATTQPPTKNLQGTYRNSFLNNLDKDDSDKDDLFNDEDTYSEEDEEDKADYMEEKADKDDDKDEADAQKEYDRSDDDDDDDEEYEVTQWTQYDYLDKDSELDNEKDGDAKEFDETNDDFGGETDEVIGKSQLPTAPYNKLLFYTWIIVAVLIVIVVISTYRSHCRGFRFPGMKMTRDQREDKKQLIKHETV